MHTCRSLNGKRVRAFCINVNWPNIRGTNRFVPFTDSAIKIFNFLKVFKLTSIVMDNGSRWISTQYFNEVRLNRNYYKCLLEWILVNGHSFSAIFVRRVLDGHLRFLKEFLVFFSIYFIIEHLNVAWGFFDESYFRKGTQVYLNSKGIHLWCSS